jgi:hypothetical protein
MTSPTWFINLPDTDLQQLTDELHKIGKVYEAPMSLDGITTVICDLTQDEVIRLQLQMPQLQFVADCVCELIQ